MPSEKSDHRGPDREVERRVDDLEGASGEERQQPDLNGIGRDRDDSRGEDAALRFLHASTLGSAGGGGQRARPRSGIRPTSASRGFP